jgi:uncharacterized protein YhbP (UPF0306 family)
VNAKTLNQARVMQLATSRGGQPWICTVYFVVSGGNFYWLSFPERRHSRELEDNTKAAVAVVLKQDLPVIGVQAEGTVHTIHNVDVAAPILELYVQKYGSGSTFIERLKEGTNEHVLYCLEPRLVVLFDETDKTQPSPRRIAIEK